MIEDSARNWAMACSCRSRVQLRIHLLWRGVGFALHDQPGGALAFAAAEGHIDAWPAWQQRHAGLCSGTVQPLHRQRAQVDLQQ